MEIKQDFCIFVANVFDNEIWNNIKNINEYAKNEFNTGIKSEYKSKTNEDTNFNHDKLNQNLNKTTDKLQELGIPTQIKTGVNSEIVDNTKIVDQITEEFNNNINNKCQKKIFVTTNIHFQELLNQFDKTVNGQIDFPKFDNFYIKEIIIACNINATEKYVKDNCNKIVQQMFNNINK